MASAGPFSGEDAGVVGQKSGEFAGGKGTSRRVYPGLTCNMQTGSNPILLINQRLARRDHTSPLSFGETNTMMEHTDRWELDVIPPLNSLTISLDVSPQELEMAVATSGASLCAAMMQAIVAAMVVDAGWAARH
jgi:hypothetical protein